MKLITPALAFTLMASMVNAEGEPLRITIGNSVDNPRTAKIDEIRHPEEIMCAIVELMPDFKDMQLDYNDSLGVFHINDDFQYIRGLFTPQGLGYDQQNYIDFAAEIGTPLHPQEIEVRLKVAELFFELQNSVDQIKPTNSTFLPVCTPLIG